MNSALAQSELKKAVRKRRRSERDMDLPNVPEDDFTPLSKRIVGLSIRNGHQHGHHHGGLGAGTGSMGLEADEPMTDDEHLSYGFNPHHLGSSNNGQMSVPVPTTTATTSSYDSIPHGSYGHPQSIQTPGPGGYGMMSSMSMSTIRSQIEPPRTTTTITPTTAQDLYKNVRDYTQLGSQFGLGERAECPNYPYEPGLYHPLYYEQNQRLYYLYLERQQRNGQILHPSFYDSTAGTEDQHRA